MSQKIVVVSTSAIPSPPGDRYAGVEAVGWHLAEGLTKLNNNVTLLTTNESEKIGTYAVKGPDGNPLGTLEVKACGATDWGRMGERNMFVNYYQWMEKEFGDGQGVVIDFSWAGYPYCIAGGKLGLAKHPKMKIIHVNHAMANWFDPVNQKFSLPPVTWPRMLGVSSAQARYLSQQYGCPVRFVYNGVEMHPQPTNPTNEGFLLSLNRISIEKGIHHCIDIAMRTNHKIKIVGADSWVEQGYVSQIVDKCHFSNGQAQYYGHVDTPIKWDLLERCKALILCPDNTRYVEAFGIAAVEANMMGKPVVALANGGLTDIIQNGVNGYLCNSVDEMVNILNSDKLSQITPENCRISAERFNIENMCMGYMEIVTGLMVENPAYNW